MDAPISLAERAQINAANKQKYEALQAEEAAAKLARKAKSRAAQEARTARMMESSCGSVEQTGNPRRGCDCEACTRRRNAKNGQQRKVRQRNAVDNRDEEWANEYRADRFAQYGLTEADYYAMLKAQDYKCPICGTNDPRGRGRKRHSGWHIDHAHATGKVRGLLCQGCNVGLGFFKDSPANLRAAAAYLED